MTWDRRLITLRRQRTKKDPTGKRQGPRRSNWVAAYPFKGHTGVGATKKEALGDLILTIAGYIDLEITS